MAWIRDSDGNLINLDRFDSIHLDKDKVYAITQGENHTLFWGKEEDAYEFMIHVAALLEAEEG